MNSRVLLFHWRVQLALLVLLRPCDQKQYFERFQTEGEGGIGTSDVGEIEVVDEVGYSSSEGMGDIAGSPPASSDRNTGQRKETESAERAWPVIREAVSAQIV